MLSATATHILALAVLAALGLGLIVWIVCLYRSFPFTPLQTTVYLLVNVLTRVLWRASFSGPLPVQPGRGAVVVCNHRSPIDPAFIGMTTRRVVHWMIAQEFWSNPLLAWIFRLAESIPASRGGTATAATKAALRYLENGEVVGLFPEGRINRTDRPLLPGRPGAAMIALKARVPIIPCYLRGSPYDGTLWGFLFMAAKVRLEIGRPLDLSAYYGREKDRETLEEVTKLLLTEIARLAGAKDFQPELVSFAKMR